MICATKPLLSAKDVKNSINNLGKTLKSGRIFDIELELAGAGGANKFFDANVDDSVKKVDIFETRKAKEESHHTSHQKVSGDYGVKNTISQADYDGLDFIKKFDLAKKHNLQIYKNKADHPEGYAAGRKSPSPENGQKALDNSIHVAGEEKLRVAVELDKNGNPVFVQLRFSQLHADGRLEYHGNQVQWEQVNQNTRTTLFRAGIIRAENNPKITKEYKNILNERYKK